MVAMAESPMRTGRSCRAVASVYGSYIDEPLCMVKANGDRFFYSTNDLYSVYALTDSDGTVVERYCYDPYGKVTVLDGNGTPRTVNESLYGNPWTFTGRRLDQETGLMYYRWRMFDVNLGRFLGRDPLQYVDGLLLYAYAAGSPALYVDPDGRIWWVAAGLIGGAIQGVSNMVVNGDYSVGRFAKGFAGGFVGGALASIGLPGVGGAAANLITGVLNGDSAENVIVNTAVGGVLGSYGAKLGSALASGPSSALVRATGPAANGLDDAFGVATSQGAVALGNWLSSLMMNYSDAFADEGGQRKNPDCSSCVFMITQSTAKNTKWKVGTLICIPCPADNRCAPTFSASVIDLEEVTGHWNETTPQARISSVRVPPNGDASCRACPKSATRLLPTKYQAPAR